MMKCELNSNYRLLTSDSVLLTPMLLVFLVSPLESPSLRRNYFVFNEGRVGVPLRSKVYQGIITTVRSTNPLLAA